jgi:hypothetical protein
LARRVSLPAADDLFRPTAPEPAEQAPAPAEPSEAVLAAKVDGDVSQNPATDSRARGRSDRSEGRGGPTRRPSGRVRHDEKMTVYVTAEELLDLEHARLSLRRDHGLAVDRGRLVREAVALALADLEARGEESVIVQRLKQV